LVAVDPVAGADAAGADAVGADAVGADAAGAAGCVVVSAGWAESGTEEDDDASGSGVLAVIVVSLGATVERRYPVRSSLAGRVSVGQDPRDHGVTVTKTRRS
jgi:hypothetical protein